jgi:single-stranded-DNA-specific exonuclease
MLNSDENKALVGLTLLSDVREIENDNAKYFLDYTYDVNLDSPLINYYIEITKADKDFGFGVEVFDRNYIDYVFSPKVNALLRFNRNEEAVRLINGSLELDFRVYLQDFRDMQKKIVDTIVYNSHDLMELKNLNIRYVYNSQFEDANFNVSNFIGVACSKIRELTGITTVVLVFNDDNTIKRGSLRGNFDTVDYLGIFRGEHIACAGHKGAFGITDMSGGEDFKLIDEAIGIAEREAFENQYIGRIQEVNNLKLFVDNRNGIYCRQIAHKNNYLRDAKRLYLKYTGLGATRYKKGKMFEFDIDGIKVKCFDEDLNLSNGLLLPLEERGYIQFYLRRQ